MAERKSVTVPVVAVAWSPSPAGKTAAVDALEDLHCEEQARVHNKLRPCQKLIERLAQAQVEAQSTSPKEVWGKGLSLN